MQKHTLSEVESRGLAFDASRRNSCAWTVKPGRLLARLKRLDGELWRQRASVGARGEPVVLTGCSFWCFWAVDACSYTGK